MTPGLLIAFILVSAYLVARLLTRQLRLIWLILWGIAPIAIVYALNPGFRIYSFHSFMHAGIVYQILNGRIPPPDPVVAGEIVHYPWLPHLGAAALCEIFNISPFVAIPVLTIASLIAVIILSVKISELLTNNRRVNLLSAIFAVYAFTPFIPEYLKILPQGTPFEIRGIPIIHKFITINTLPVGLAAWLLTTYAALKYFTSARPAKPFGLLAGGILATAALYPAFLPGLGSAVILGLVASWLLRHRTSSYLIRTGISLAALAAVVLLLTPYMKAISGSVANLAVLNPAHVGKNTIKYLLINAPMIILAVITLRHLLSVLDQRTFAIVAIIAVATFGCYIAIHLPLDNEYKLLLLSSVTLGILGGPIFGGIEARWGRIATFILIMVFLLPTFRIVWLRTSAGRKIPSTFFEQGSLVKTKAKDQELYDWIMEATPVDAIFIDSELDIPVLGQRQIFVPYAQAHRSQRKGFGLINVILESQSGYGRQLTERRRQIVRDLYSPRKMLSVEDVDYLAGLGSEIYVVARSRQIAEIVAAKHLKPVFRSSDGAISVYRMEFPLTSR